MTDDFDADFGVDEWHGTNAFIRDGDRVFRTYFINTRGDEAMGSTWSYLDITALGRQEEWEDSPGGLPADAAVRVVELARRTRQGRILIDAVRSRSRTDLRAHWSVLMAEVVATSDTVGSTRARSTKIAALAELLGRLAPDEIEAAVGFLTGEARQGRSRRGLGHGVPARRDAGGGADADDRRRGPRPRPDPGDDRERVGCRP